MSRINWNLIWKEYAKLGIPSEYWKPNHINFNESAYKVLISERSLGKTTQLLLLYLLINEKYGDRFAYIRQKQRMITPKANGRVFTAIRENGYVEKITKGKWKDIYLYAGVWRYCNRDPETQKITEQSDVIGYSLSVDQTELYKSNFSDDKCNLLLYDEFISSSYTDDEFENYMNLISTVGRYRPDVYIVMLANNLNPYAMYLQELGISRQVQRMQFGEHKLVTSGTVPIYIELISNSTFNVTTKMTLRDKLKMFRFGFDNPRLASITGSHNWNLKQYPHIYKPLDITKDRKLISFLIKLDADYIKGNLYIYNHMKYIHFQPYQGNRYKGDLRVYTLNAATTNRERFGTGYDHLDKLIWSVIVSTNHTFFATNECGMILTEFLNEFKVKSLI